MSVHPGADADVLRLQYFQELREMEVETAPDRFAIILTTDDFLDRRVSPDLPAVAFVFWFPILKTDVQAQGVTFPAIANGCQEIP
jgi:hypothetical protein